MCCCCMNQIPGGTLCDDCAGPECQVVLWIVCHEMETNIC